MNAENKTLQDLLTLLDTNMTFKTKCLDRIEGTMFGHDARVLIRTQLLSFVGDGRWSKVELYVMCGGESMFTWGCVGRDDEQIIRDWWYATREQMEIDDDKKRRSIKQAFVDAQKEILENA